MKNLSHLVRTVAKWGLPLLAIVGLLSLILGPVPSVKALNNGLALTPPMGWNSWNKYGCNVSDALIRQQADAMVSSGMAAVGYQYINIDDCWQEATRTNGHVTPTSGFPNGISAVADYVHSKGLKLGVYSDRGDYTCAGRAGSYGYETTDANDYASWGVDYLKYDNCNAHSGSNQQQDYTNMKDALANSGRSIVFSICAWEYKPWMPSVGNLWRTTLDITDSWNGMIWIPNINNSSAAESVPGAWNDPDMLEVGNGGMTETEYYTHMSLWVIMAAPLLAGNDMTNMSSATLATLTNPEVIAVNQDALGAQGVRVWWGGSGNSLNVWSKKLSGTNTRAVVLFNGTSSSASITVNWSQLGIPAGNASVRNLWTRTNLGTFKNSYTASNIPAHGSVMLKIVGPSSGSTATPMGGYYYTVINRNSAKLMDVSGGSYSDGAKIIQWYATDGSNQDWQFLSRGSGYYSLVNRNSGKCLDVSGGSTADGAEAVQWTCNSGSYNQQFTWVPDGNFFKLVARHSGKCLGVSAGSQDDGAQIIQWTCLGIDDQRWSRGVRP